MKKILLIVGVMALSLPVYAGISVQEVTNPEYLRNYGYSNETVKYVQMQKAAVDGIKFVNSYSNQPYRKYYTNSELWNNLVDLTRGIFIYLDPSLDGDKFMRQDTKYYADYQDM